jgi:ribosome-associated translation inhibitor RaiA
MQLSVTGKQIGVGDGLRDHIETALDATVSGYFDAAALEDTWNFPS